MFQSLLWWIGSRQREPDSRRPGAVAVSILVVVDCSRQQRARRRPASDHVMFQSLLWWIAVVNHAVPTPCQATTMAFQSLLWWIAVVNSDRRASRWQSPAEFQSLLWWIGQSSTTARSSYTSEHGLGFNPCCGGLQSSTTWPAPARPPFSLFQSLLWWIAVVNHRGLPCADRPADRFQSLLWWIAVVNWSSARARRWRIRRFQSLLWWIAVVNTVARPRRLRKPSVSILVVVDCSRQPRSKLSTRGLVSRVSILVVVDWSVVNGC